MSEIDNYFGMPEKEAEIRKHDKLEPKERTRLYREKKLKENPNWDKERMKKWRNTHPDSWNYGQCRYFFRKLTAEQRQRLLNDI